MLGRKLVRELAREKGQTVAVAAVVGLGVLLFIASWAAYQDLRDSYASTRRELRLADLHVDLAAAAPGDAARARGLAGVVAAEARTLTTTRARLAGHAVELRVISLTAALDQVLIVDGRAAAAAGELVLERHAAQHFHLVPGAVVEVAGRPARVVGIGVSAEYLWVARDEQDFLPGPDRFAVAWAPAGATPEGAIAHQLLIALEPAVDRAAAADQLAVALGAARVTRVVPPDRLVGVRLLQLDVDGYRGMAAFFPILFLGVGALIVATILARVVDGQRAVIGTLAALGVGPARIFGHYLALGAVLGAIGALLGAIGGAALGPALTRAYATELGIPFVTTHLHAGVAAIGLALGTGACALAALVPAVRAARAEPSAAMRPPRPRTGALARALRRVRAPLVLRMAIRGVLGRPLRSAATAVGVAAAVVVVVATGGMLDAMRATFTSTFAVARRDDLRLELRAPAPMAAVVARLGAMGGVRRAEGILAVPLVLAAGDRRAAALVRGLDDDAVLERSLDTDGRVVAPRAGGIVLTRALARALAVAPGDPVDAGGASFRVDGVADAVLGPTATVRRDDLGRALGLAGQVTQVALGLAAGHPADLADRLAALPDAARVEDVAATRAEMDDLMGLGWAMLGAMLAFASVLAAAILYNTANLGVLERRRELATLRALGCSHRQLAVGVTLEHLALALAGVAVGLPVALAVTGRIDAAFSSELFSLPDVVSGATVAAALGGIVVVLLLGQWPALRVVRRMSLAEAVRTRDG